MDVEEDLFEVVISGVSGKYPLSEDIEELRENLLAQKCLVTEDDCRWNRGKNQPDFIWQTPTYAPCLR